MREAQLEITDINPIPSIVHYLQARQRDNVANLTTVKLLKSNRISKFRTETELQLISVLSCLQDNLPSKLDENTISLHYFLPHISIPDFAELNRRIASTNLSFLCLERQVAGTYGCHTHKKYCIHQLQNELLKDIKALQDVYSSKLALFSLPSLRSIQENCNYLVNQAVKTHNNLKLLEILPTTLPISFYADKLARHFDYILNSTLATDEPSVTLSTPTPYNQPSLYNNNKAKRNDIIEEFIKEHTSPGKNNSFSRYNSILQGVKRLLRCKTKGILLAFNYLLYINDPYIGNTIIRKNLDLIQTSLGGPTSFIFNDTHLSSLEAPNTFVYENISTLLTRCSKTQNITTAAALDTAVSVVTQNFTIVFLSKDDEKSIEEFFGSFYRGRAPLSCSSLCIVTKIGAQDYSLFNSLQIIGANMESLLVSRTFFSTNTMDITEYLSPSWYLTPWKPHEMTLWYPKSKCCTCTLQCKPALNTIAIRTEQLINTNIFRFLSTAGFFTLHEMVDLARSTISLKSIFSIFQLEKNPKSLVPYNKIFKIITMESSRVEQLKKRKLKLGKARSSNKNLANQQTLVWHNVS